jgi:hypothetical protein
MVATTSFLDLLPIPVNSSQLLRKRVELILEGLKSFQQLISLYRFSRLSNAVYSIIPSGDCRFWILRVSK